MAGENKVAGVFLVKDTALENSLFLQCAPLRHLGGDIELLRGFVPLPEGEEFAREFVFLTKDGWELDANFEKQMKIDDLLCPGNVIRVRMKDKAPRVGIILCNQPAGGESAIGYVCLPSFKGTVSTIRTTMEEQLPSLYKKLVSNGLQFLDCNGWPITKSQEEKLLLIRIVTNNVVKIQTVGVAGHTPTPSPIPPIIEIAEEFLEPVLGSSPPPLPLPPTNSFHPTRHSLPRPSLKPFDIMISYVHRETSKFANLLCDELRRLNYSVFIDVQYIKPGIDWQDVLNEAVYNCSLFVPLVSNHYGLTDWTNKEVKLADTLEKAIIPINFTPVWPPMCLAIQFATTQYIRWGKNASNLEPRTIASKSAAEISERYKVIEELKQEMEDKHEEVERIEVEVVAREKTEQAEKPNGELASKKHSTGKRLSSVIRKSLMKSHSVCNLVVVTCHPSQAEITEGIQAHLEGRGYEVWASSAGTDPQKRQQFKSKVNEAGAVVFVLSSQFALEQWCEQEVYYCEGRKRIIPIIVEDIEMPCWMSTLIGTETFLDSRSNTFYDNLSEEVEYATQPSKAEGRLRKLVEQKTQLHRMCTDLNKNLPTGKLVYISGGTKLFSQNGESICREIGKFLAKDRNVVLVTGGFYGVGEIVGRSFYEERKCLGWDRGVVHIQALKDSQDRTLQTRQNADGTFQKVPYGITLFNGCSIRQREMLTAKCLDLCILIEGGPGAASEAHQFSWNDHTVVPVMVTGGAAGGKFNVPSTIFIKPENVPETEWATLKDEKASPTDIAKAVATIVALIKSP